MSQEIVELDEKKASLALVVARGDSIQNWARKNDVVPRTAYRWANERAVRMAADEWRRLALNKALGRMTRESKRAVEGIARLAKTAESDSVRLAAWKSILKEQMAIAKFSTLEWRMTEIEEDLGIDSNGKPVQR